MEPAVQRTLHRVRHEDLHLAFAEVLDVVIQSLELELFPLRSRSAFAQHPVRGQLHCKLTLLSISEQNKGASVCQSVKRFDKRMISTAHRRRGEDRIVHALQIIGTSHTRLPWTS